MGTGLNPIAEFLSGFHQSYRRNKQRQQEVEDREDEQRIRTIGQILNDPNLPDETRQAVTGHFTAMLGGKNKEKKKAYESIMSMISGGVPTGQRTKEITIPGQDAPETRPRTVTPEPTRKMEGIVTNPTAETLPPALGRQGSAYSVPPAQVPVGSEPTSRPFFSTREERIQNEIEPRVRLEDALEPGRIRSDERRYQREIEKVRLQQEAFLKRQDARTQASYQKRFNEYMTIYGGDEAKAREMLQREIDSRILGREARTENARANTAYTNLKARFLPEDKAAVQTRLQQGWERLSIAEARLAKGQADGTLSKSDISNIRMYMNRVAGLYRSAETLVNKNLGEEQQYEPGALDEAELARRSATREQMFDQVAGEARREAMNLKILMGDKVEIGSELGPDNLEGDWIYIKPVEEVAPSAPGTIGPRPAPPAGSGAKMFPASKLQEYAQKYTNGDMNAARKRLTVRSASNPNPYTIDESK